MLDAVSRLNGADYDQIKAVLCPYCAAKLPDVRKCDRSMWVHFIPKTPHEFDCVANPLREERK